MSNAVILRIRHTPLQGGRPRTWYEYAPIVDGKIQRLSNHTASSPLRAAQRARLDGYDPDLKVVDV